MAKGLPNICIKFTSPWRGQPHQWSSTAFHSGSPFTAQSDMVGMLQAYYAIIAGFITTASGTFLSQVLYYDGIASSAKHEAIFTTQAEANAAGYLTTDLGAYYTVNAPSAAGLECCIMLEGPVGLSSTGKPVKLRKFIHGVSGVGQGPDQIPQLEPAAATAVATLGTGFYGNRVIAANSGKQASGWAINGYYGNHQMPRKRKKKNNGSLLSIGADFDRLRQLANAIADE